LDLSGEKDIDTRVQALIEEEAAHPFDLGVDPPLRGRVLCVGDDDYVLMLTVHHHAFDGLSEDAFCGELNTAYAAYSSGGVPSLPPLVVQYSDWAAWQRLVLADGIEDKVARARERLADSPDVLTLPVDYPRRADRSRRAGHISFTLPASLVSGLEALAVQEGTTLFTVMLAAYGGVLSRLSGQDDVVIGSPVAGRDRAEADGLIGFLVNTLALPLSVGGMCDGRTLIGRARASVEAALVDQDLPFERLVEDLGVTRSLDRSPVFQAMLTFDPGMDEVLGLSGIEISGMETGLNTAKFDVDLSFAYEGDGSLVGALSYDADLFAASSVGGWVDAFTLLIEGLVSDSAAPVLTLPILNEEGQQQVITSSSGPVVEHDTALLTLPCLFDAQSEKTPDAVALIYEDQHLSYGDLASRSNQLARYLIERGVGPDAVVAILLDRSFEMIVAMLGVLKAGGAYLPLDPEYPAQRLSFMIGDSGSVFVISDGDLYAGLDTQDAVLPPQIDVYDAALLQQLEALPDGVIAPSERLAPLQPEHLAYLIYTSGSTGVPKGAGNSHDGITNRLSWMQDVLKLTEKDRILQKTAIGFDVSVWEWVLP